MEIRCQITIEYMKKYVSILGERQRFSFFTVKTNNYCTELS